MKCTPVDFGNGVTGFVCGRSPRRQRCKSCGALADLECDYPIESENPPAPRVGDARVNIHNRKVFYVWGVNAQSVVVHTKRPTLQAIPRGALEMSFATWLERTRRTCDEPVCGKCVRRFRSGSSTLDFCPGHARAYVQSLAKAKEPSEG